VPGDPDLEAVLPDTIGGQPLEVDSFNAAELAAQFEANPGAADELGGILATAGKQVDDVSIAGGNVATADGALRVTVLRVAGADASQLITGLVPFVTGIPADAPRSVSLGGRDLLAVGDEADPVYVHPAGDLLFLFAGSGPPLEEFVAALP
jgi:hypothetical protein